jgi:hypothetical protein
MTEALKPTVFRIYADKDGNSRIEEHAIVADMVRNALQSLAINPTMMLIRQYQPRYTHTWHVTPARQFAIALYGSLESEVSGGVKTIMGPGQLVFLDDTHGNGHVTRMLDACANLFIRVPDDFDFHAWVRGPAAATA